MLFNQKFVSVPCGQREMHRRNQDLSFVLELSNALAAMNGPDEVLETGLRKVRDQFGFETGRVYLVDHAREILVLHASQGLDVGGLEQMGLDEGFSGRAYSGRVFLAQRVDDLDDAKRVGMLRAKGLESVVCLPLIVRDAVIGVMNLGAKRVMELTMPLIDLMMVAGNLIAVAAQNTLAATALERQKESIRFFAYTASHDLKGPAVGIHGLTRLLMRTAGEKLDPRGQAICRQIENAAGRMELLVSEINAYIAASEAPLDLQSVPVAEVLDEVRLDFETRLRGLGVGFATPLDPPVVWADRLGLMRVFENLVDNALKYGGPNLSRIEVAHHETESHHVFSVSDNGVGLTPAQAEKIFDAFSRSETSRGSQGSGLGLGIVKAVASRHGGEAWVECAPGKGCTFYFSVLKRAKADSPGDDTGPKADESASGGHAGPPPGGRVEAQSATFH